MKQTNRSAVLGATMVASFLAAMEVTIVGTAMPTIVGVLQGLELFSWVVTGYLLAQTITTPIYGKLADLYGRKRTFFVGATIFLIGSLLSGAAPSMEWLVFARIVQGLGGGAIMPVTVTLIGDLFPGKERGKAQGVVASVWGIASVLGPLLGVFIVSTLGWKWVFWINLPVGLAAMAALWVALHEEVKPSKHGLDIPGAALLAVSVGALLYALRFSGGSPVDPLMLSMMGAGLLLMVLFIWHESRAPEPLVPLSLFRNRFFAVATGTGFLTGFALTAVTVFLPLFVQGALGGSPADNGRVLTAMSVAWSATAFASGRWLLPRIGTRVPAVWGVGIIAVGSFLLALLGRDWSLIRVMGITVILGVGFGLSIPGFIILVQESVGWNMRGVATSGVQFARSLGNAVAAAVLGTTLNNILVPRLGGVPSLADKTPEQRLELTNSLLGEGGIAALPPEMVAAMQGALAEGLHAAFRLVAVTAVLALAVALLVRSGPGVAGHGSGGRDQVGHGH